MPRLYVTMRPLPPEHYPARLLRSATVTLQVIDPRASKQELLSKLFRLVEPWEHEAGCRAYGQPPPGHHMSTEMVTGSVLPYVPPCVRVPGESAVQNPDLHSEGGRRAFLDALEWHRLERMMSIAV